MNYIRPAVIRQTFCKAVSGYQICRTLQPHVLPRKSLRKSRTLLSLIAELKCAEINILHDKYEKAVGSMGAANAHGGQQTDTIVHVEEVIFVTSRHHLWNLDKLYNI